MALTACWIWKKQRGYRRYNQAVVARKRFRCGPVRSARMAITADTRYRLHINGRWVNDGPCRSWPEHYQYDVLDVAPYLQSGANEIRIVARFFGCGTFHQVPQQAGLLAQLDLTMPDGSERSIGTDRSWEVAELHALSGHVPKIAVQMGPFEWYDARLGERLRFSKSAVLHKAGEGPWRNLSARDCPLLTREPEGFVCVSANIVGSQAASFTIPVQQLAYPDLISSNSSVARAAVFACRVVANKACRRPVYTPFTNVTVNGQKAVKGKYAFRKGANFILGAVTEFFTHWATQVLVEFPEPEGLGFENLFAESSDPWCLVPLKELLLVDTDHGFADRNASERQAITARISGRLEEILRDVESESEFKQQFGKDVLVPGNRAISIEDPHRAFMNRRVLGQGAEHIEDAAACLADNATCTVVHPSPEGDAELVLDMGRQIVGYLTFELCAAEGTVIDAFGVEYMDEAGRVQHTEHYRNGLRYVCKEGWNRFLSFYRRSQRHLFLTIRNQSSPVRIRHINVVGSTYPVETRGAFSCSDLRLDEIWQSSAHTLKLCMEDTFTDCPLYEQTLWVGDARNEALYGYAAYGAEDLAKRCIRLAAESLESSPMVLCQVPTCWEWILPAWSFLWGIMVWDYYWRTADEAFLGSMWPAVVRNLRGAEERVNKEGLFSAAYWNLLDWANIDDKHDTVTHNTMLMVGAIEAALKCAGVLGDRETAAWLRGLHKRLGDAACALWDEKRPGYPDSIHNDGSISSSTCIHNHFLAILYSVPKEEQRERCIAHMLHPPDWMVSVGSPFVQQYYYEALESVGEEDRVVADILDKYLPMLEYSTGTVWESFPGGNIGFDGFPTRSYTHAWAALPIHFLNRIVLGIRQTKPGCRAFEISPRPNGLAWAKGATAALAGEVRVNWRIENGAIHIDASAPPGTRLRFRNNDALEQLSVFYNGRKVR